MPPSPDVVLQQEGEHFSSHVKKKKKRKEGIVYIVYRNIPYSTGCRLKKIGTIKRTRRTKPEQVFTNKSS